MTKSKSHPSPPPHSPPAPQPGPATSTPAPNPHPPVTPPPGAGHPAELPSPDESITIPAHEWHATQAALSELPALQDRLLRLQADFENSRRRLERDREESVRYANASLLEDLLPLLDNFQLGLQAAESAPDAKSILQGMQMVRAQIERFLKEQGVEEIQALGQPFDPLWHEAVGQQPSPAHPEGTVLSQTRRGYRLRDRLLRPALVIVSHNSPESKP